jgi:Rieske Fe-S protein
MTDHPLSTPMQRRTVLAAAAATGVLAACGSSDDNGTTDQGTAQDSQGSGSGEVLADVADVPVEGGTVNRDAGFVVTQPTDGDYRAFSATCPHEQCLVSRVENNVITCTCHGSRFSAETGDVESGPAPRGLAEIDVVVEGESIVRA